MAKDVRTAIRKSIVVSFLPCLIAFLGFHPYMVLNVFFCNLYHNKLLLVYLSRQNG